VTHNLAEGVYKNRWDHTRDSVRRTSGFVLTGYPEIMPNEEPRTNNCIYGTGSLLVLQTAEPFPL